MVKTVLSILLERSAVLPISPDLSIISVQGQERAQGTHSWVFSWPPLPLPQGKR